MVWHDIGPTHKDLILAKTSGVCKFIQIAVFILAAVAYVAYAGVDYEHNI
jgi:hypothetical protein